MFNVESSNEISGPTGASLSQNIVLITVTFEIRLQSPPPYSLFALPEIVQLIITMSEKSQLIPEYIVSPQLLQTMLFELSFKLFPIQWCPVRAEPIDHLGL